MQKKHDASNVGPLPGLVRAGLFACAGVLACACSDAGRPPRLQVLSFVRTIGGNARDANDTTLLIPLDLAVQDSVVAVLDQAGPTVRVLAFDGRLLRVVGRRGQGRGEFLEPRGIAASASGVLAVTDGRNRRVTLVDPASGETRTFPVRDGRLGEAAFDGQGRLHVDRRGRAEAGAAGIVSVFDSSGAQASSWGAYLSDTDPFADAYLNQVQIAFGHAGDAWVLYPYRGTLEHRSAGMELLQTVRLPAPQGRPADGPFTQASPDDPNVVMVIRMPVADDVVVAPGGRVLVAVMQTPTDQPAFSEVLVYGGDGTLLGSQRLPRPARRMAVHGGNLYALADHYGGASGIDVFRIVP